MTEDRLFLICSENNIRLDSFLSTEAEVSRSRACSLIQEGFVLVNEKLVAKNYRLRAGDRISYELPEISEIEAVPQDIPLDIFYEDDDIIVINKPQGMVVHPAPGNPDHTLVNALLFHCHSSLSGINGKIRPGIVHRIDKDTSGLIVAAKNDAAHIALSDMFHNHNFVRKYEAIVHGSLKNDSGVVRLAIGRSPKDRKKMTFFPMGTPNTKDAITHYRVIERFPEFTHVELTLETGRTHQIRVHMLSLSCPVAGDPVYASGRKNRLGLNGQCLHAKFIEFHHPITGSLISLSAPLPDYFKNALNRLK